MLSKEQQNIIENSIWVVNTALKKQGFQGDEDLRQSAILYMCKCLERFDPSKNIKWTTFAYKNIYLFIKRTHNKEKKLAKRMTESDVLNILEDNGDLEIYDKECARQTIYSLKTLCTEEECKFIDLKLEGYKGAEISQIMQCSTSKVICCMQSIKEKAKGICDDYR